MSKKTIVVCDHIHQSGLDILANDSEIELINAADEPKDKLIAEIIPLADVAITRSSTDVDAAFLESAKKITAIVRAGVGVDNVDIPGSSKQGIVVMNVPTANTIAAVELTLAHMLSCVRQFPYAHNNLKLDRVWRRQDWYGTELKDKKLGIIGFGNIGSRVGKRAKAFEMDVLAYDPYIDPSKATDLDIGYTKNFEDILACDIITIHTPKTEETIGMISKDEIAKMKDGVILINCARGGLYNEEALLEGLKSGKIAMAGIDVFNKEPATDHPLLDLDNVTVTPHLGANTKESQRNIAIQAAENAIAAAKGIAYPNALNLPIKENELPDFVRPYLELIQKMGHLSSQVTKSAVKSIKVTAKGPVSDYLASMQTFATVGVLTESLADQVNYVNAEFVAKERGIELANEVLPNTSGFTNKVKIKLTTADSTIMIAGTVFDDTVQRIIEIDDYILDVEPKGTMIFFRNTDTPGVIGDVGRILAENGLNISDFRLGRDKKQQALAVVRVDGQVSKDVLDALSALEACISVSHATL
ncbi:3-phosphoglycerate dehydrogenase [Sulfurovum lithotrophicum]|uniref:D-3-phosphoglycerate dehydrogenase n=1 Tax=Sulfurovum lithotrophicum TaxID=206403 RepID=A0A7U4M2A0_9BACT|nr:phosphoglycerate dehydrogenase [Sulfurovum lithotrophicum]AKF25399.1 3-phosphoglycerate dehydrogenase [Sulfurovum lithotrophicum]